MANFLKKLFGTKADRDIREINPTLKLVLAEFDRVDRLSDDDLREACQQLKAQIASRTADMEAEAAQERYASRSARRSEARSQRSQKRATR